MVVIKADSQNFSKLHTSEDCQRKQGKTDEDGQRLDESSRHQRAQANGAAACPPP